MVEIIETSEDVEKRIPVLAKNISNVLVDIGKGKIKGAKDVYENLELYFTDTQIRLLATTTVMNGVNKAIEELSLARPTKK
jgi:hypothetical protein